MKAAKKSLVEVIRSSDSLFADDTVVIHVSGNKDNAGIILKANQGLSKVFGYSNTEVIGHLINILMPTIYAKRHTEYLERFFKTGHKTVFNVERNFFALHRNGYCFHMKFYAKQMPKLDEGIQYVAMIKATESNNDYILTDMRGVIDSFSAGVTSLLNLEVSLFKQTEVNIQILAPELMTAFSTTDTKNSAMEKFKETGGKHLTFFVPKDFSATLESKIKKNAKEAAKHHQGKQKLSTSRTSLTLYKDINRYLNKHNGITSNCYNEKMLTHSDEYKMCSSKQTIKCQIQDCVYGEINNSNEPLKLRVFKLEGIRGKNLELSSDDGDEFMKKKSEYTGSCVEYKDIPASSNLIGENLVKKELMNLFDSNKYLNKAQNQGQVQEEKREETKTTEKIPGNQIQTESHVDPDLDPQEGVSLPTEQVKIEEIKIQKEEKKSIRELKSSKAVKEENESDLFCEKGCLSEDRNKLKIGVEILNNSCKSEAIDSMNTSEKMIIPRVHLSSGNMLNQKNYEKEKPLSKFYKKGNKKV